jgi:plasmid maintenance system antidote protein VapI
MRLVKTEQSEIAFEPTNSRLFPLELAGLGTNNVEAFTSYLVRIANEHCLKPYTLISNEILPTLNKPYLFDQEQASAGKLGSSWWKGISVTLNGLNPLTLTWVQSLNELTFSDSLIYSTFLTYRKILPYRGLIAGLKKWCPICYEEWRIAQHTMYDPLIWMVNPVQICPKHLLKLYSCCPFPDCQKTLTAISPHAYIGFCCHCNRWLGTPFQNPQSKLNEETIEEQKFIITVVGEMLAAAPTIKNPLQTQNISLAIHRYINEHLAGNVQALATLMKMHRKSICELRDGTQMPQIGTLIKLCKFFGLTPLQLVTQNVSDLVFTPPPNRIKCSVSRNQKKYRKFDSEVVRNVLTERIAANETPPPSMAQVARELKYDQSFLAEHLPRECEYITKRYAEYKSQQKAARIERYCEKVRQVTLEIHKQGFYPSRCRVGNRGLFKEQKVQQTYKETMKNLGYRR